MVFAGIGNVFDATQRHVRRDEMRVVGNESRPLLILGHGDGTAAEAFDSFVCIVAFALENARESVVRLLNLADDDRLQLATGSLEVEVGLVMLVIIMRMEEAGVNYPVKIVLLVNLPLDRAIHTESDNKWIIFAGGIAAFVVDMLQSILQLLDFTPCSILLLVDGVLEVTAQTLNLLDLLAQVTAQARKTTNDVAFDFARLVGFGERVPVEVFQDASRVGKTIVRHHDGGMRDATNGALDLADGFGAGVIGALNLAEVGNQRLEQLAPGLEAVGQNVCRRALSGNRSVECRVEVLGLVAASHAPDASSGDAPATATALDAAGGPGRAAHARLFLESVVPGGHALVGGLAVGDGGGGARGGAVDTRGMLRVDGGVRTRGVEVLVELTSEVLLAH